MAKPAFKVGDDYFDTEQEANAAEASAAIKKHCNEIANLCGFEESKSPVFKATVKVGCAIIISDYLHNNRTELHALLGMLGGSSAAAVELRDWKQLIEDCANWEALANEVTEKRDKYLEELTTIRREALRMLAPLPPESSVQRSTAELVTEIFAFAADAVQWEARLDQIRDLCLEYASMEASDDDTLELVRRALDGAADGLRQELKILKESHRSVLEQLSDTEGHLLSMAHDLGTQTAFPARVSGAVAALVGDARALQEQVKAKDAALQLAQTELAEQAKALQEAREARRIYEQGTEARNAAVERLRTQRDEWADKAKQHASEILELKDKLHAAVITSDKAVIEAASCRELLAKAKAFGNDKLTELNRVRYSLVELAQDLKAAYEVNASTDELVAAIKRSAWAKSELYRTQRDEAREWSDRREQQLADADGTRKAAAEALGLTGPATWQVVLEACAKLERERNEARAALEQTAMRREEELHALQEEISRLLKERDDFKTRLGLGMRHGSYTCGEREGQVEQLQRFLDERTAECAELREKLSKVDSVVRSEADLTEKYGILLDRFCTLEREHDSYVQALTDVSRALGIAESTPAAEIAGAVKTGRERLVDLCNKVRVLVKKPHPSFVELIDCIELAAGLDKAMAAALGNIEKERDHLRGSVIHIQNECARVLEVVAPRGG